MAIKKPLNIYLAGSCSTAWRDEITGGVELSGDFTKPYDLPLIKGAIFGIHNLTGAYPVARTCHDYYGHKLNLEWHHDRYDTDEVRRLLFDASMDAIARSDVLFAWIDRRDLYGTMVEIGHAHALKKKVWIAAKKTQVDLGAFDNISFVDDDSDGCVDEVDAPATQSDRYRQNDYWFSFFAARPEFAVGCDSPREALEAFLSDDPGIEIGYQEYLKTDHWQSVRAEATERAGGKCQLCASKTRLEVHHNNYKNLWHEEPTDVIVLCHQCHSKHHGRESK